MPFKTKSKDMVHITSIEFSNHFLRITCNNDSYCLKKITDIEALKKDSESLLETVSDAEVNSRISFEEFTDERILISHDAFGK